MWVIGIVAAVVVLAVVAVERAKAAPQTYQVQLVAGVALPLTAKSGDTIVAQAPSSTAGSTPWTPPVVTTDTNAMAGGSGAVLATSAQAMTYKVTAKAGSFTIESFAGSTAPPGVVLATSALLNVTVAG